MILEDEFKKVSDKFVMMTDDGSYGEKGLVTNALKALLDAGEKYDEVIAIGPLIMMKFISKLTKEYGVKTVVSMNPIMIDGTGMCGGCRLTVGGKQNLPVWMVRILMVMKLILMRRWLDQPSTKNLNTNPMKNMQSFQQRGELICRICL